MLANTVFDNALEGISITDASGTIVNVNPAFSRITGYSRDEAIGQNPRILKSGRQSPAFYDAIRSSLVEVGHWSGEIWNRRKDGLVYPESLAISAARDSEGTTRHYVAIFSDITLRKQAEERVHHQAMFDALTGLPNRSLLFDHLSLSLAASRRRCSHGGLLFLDLDNFKPLNDTHGHDAGDQLLVEVANRLRTSVREVDTVARFGGDEFVVLLNDLAVDKQCAKEVLHGIAEKLRVGLAAPYRILVKNGDGLTTRIDHSCSTSIGGLVFMGQAVSQDDLIKWADIAMYSAKSTGGDRVQLRDA
jgi:diguanylate cyclase (GGDEF)-like protein/PAS domain S-box-containing protein